jgi:uncharacterized protein YuzE
MEKFNFDYDSENDDLFVYLTDKKSAGAVELGNFILDFDKGGNLVAFQISTASEVFSKILSKMIEITKLKQIQAEIINFRNMDAIRFKVITENNQETANILIPHITKKSPVLEY